MGRIEWAMWGNEQAVIAAYVTFVGAVVSVASLAESNSIYNHTRWQIAAYGIAISILMFLIEYPRSKRRKGKVVQRRGQHILANLVSCCGPFGKHYIFRFVFYLLAGVPCLFQLGTVLGGLSMIFAGIIYLFAAIGGEKWVACEQERPIEKRYTRAAPPTSAPPRLQPNNENGVTEAKVVENANATNGKV